MAYLLKRHQWGGRMLDLGCGEGRHTLLFAKVGFFTVGLDYPATLLRTVAQRTQSRICLDFTR